ncbi:MAG: penicillin-binding protein 2 [Bacteroidia bacterium]|nr:penicillin-binding protein 2 [Bacteroidia bacterium]
MNRTFSERKLVIIAIFIATGLACIGRLYYMQIIDDSYKLDASNEAFRHVTQYPPRGCIFDRNGKLLVTNEAAYDILVVPSQVRDIDTASFCNDLGIKKDDFISGIKKAIVLNTATHPSVFLKEVTPEIYASFEEKMYKYHGFSAQVRTIRKYPMKIAPHLLGYIGEVSKELCARNPKYKEGDYIGISGMEESYESDLGGIKGEKIMMMDAMNREVGEYKNGKYSKPPDPGENLTCTLDAALQAYGEKLMANKAGSIVAIEPATGEILALVSSPEYDPNLLIGSVRAKNYAKLAEDTLTVPLFNRALMAQYPPGSTFKPIEALIGQQEGTLTPQTSYYCPGAFIMGSNVHIACDSRHGSLQLQDAIAKSCNTYFCNVFVAMMNNRSYGSTEEAFEAWRKYVLGFGFGARPDIDLPSALRGNVPAASHYDKTFGEGRWKAGTIAWLGIGQGELEVTPLQLADEAAIIANRGYYITPHVVKGIGTKAGPAKKYTLRHYVPVDEKYFQIVVDGMSDVVSGGTAAASKIPGIIMCGKTGTAQNPYGRDNSLFIAFAPKDTPRIAVSVVVERGGWGADWAAPIASLMIEKYLNGTVKRTDLEQRMMEGNTLNYLLQEKTEPKAFKNSASAEAKRKRSKPNKH